MLCDCHFFVVLRDSSVGLSTFERVTSRVIADVLASDHRCINRSVWSVFAVHRQQTNTDEIESLEQPENRTTGFIRLFMAAGAMVLFLISVETAGLVIGSMILFLVMIFIVTQTISIRFFVIAVILPVALYGFFAHVASVAIPQGEWMQLP